MAEAEEGFVYVNGVGVYDIYTFLDSENKPIGYSDSYTDMIHQRTVLAAAEMPEYPPGYEPHWEECPAHVVSGWFFVSGRYVSAADLERYKRIGRFDF